jgi:hypothetical protein
MGLIGLCRKVRQYYADKKQRKILGERLVRAQAGLASLEENLRSILFLNDGHFDSVDRDRIAELKTLIKIRREDISSLEEKLVNLA